MGFILCGYCGSELYEVPFAHNHVSTCGARCATCVDKKPGESIMQDADHNVNLEEPETLNEVRLRGSDGKPEGFPVELADAVIRQVIKDKLARIADLCGQLDIDLEQVIKDKLTRIADLCGRLDIDIEQVIKDKLAYNKTRPHMHGRTC